MGDTKDANTHTWWLTAKRSILSPCYQRNKVKWDWDHIPLGPVFVYFNPVFHIYAPQNLESESLQLSYYVVYSTPALSVWMLC